MKYLIIYSSKYGFTEECTIKLERLLEGDVKRVTSKELGSVNLGDYEHVVIGSSVYIGQIDKKIKEFVIKYERALLNTPVSLFLCCGAQPDETGEIYKNNFPESILSHSQIKECFGGEFRTDRMGFFNRLIISKVAKSKENENKPEPKYIDGSIEKFVEKIGVFYK